MRILIANDQHWPMKSGCAQASRTQALGLSKLGHTVMVLAPSATSRNDTDFDTNYDIVRVRSFKFRNNLRVSVPLDREVRRVLREFNPDVVHVHTQLTLGLAVLRAATAMGIPVVATNHVMPDNIIQNVKLLSSLSRPIGYIWTEYGNLLYRGARAIVMPTGSALSLFNLDRIEAPVMAISNGIDLKRFVPEKAPKSLYDKFEIPKDKTIISYLGRLDNEKHIDVVLAAYAHLRSQGYENTHLMLVGAGNADKTLRRLVTSLEIDDSVTFTGLVSDEDWPLLHRITDIYTMPSPNELQSIATLEAMACGKPIVSVDAGALAELCHNDENGYLVHVDDAKGFTRAFRMLLDKPERMEEFGKASRRIAETHDETIVMPQFVSLYESVIAESSATTGQSDRASRSVLSGRRSR